MRAIWSRQRPNGAGGDFAAAGHSRVAFGSVKPTASDPPEIGPGSGVGAGVGVGSGVGGSGVATGSGVASGSGVVTGSGAATGSGVATGSIVATGSAPADPGRTAGPPVTASPAATSAATMHHRRALGIARVSTIPDAKRASSAVEAAAAAVMLRGDACRQGHIHADATAEPRARARTRGLAG